MAVWVPHLAQARPARLVATHGAQDWLVKLPDLSGLWGMERFGLSDIKVLRALEGLEGVERCALYKLIEERSTVAAEKARLDKLVQSKSKQVTLPSCIVLTLPACGSRSASDGHWQRDGASILRAADAG